MSTPPPMSDYYQRMVESVNKMSREAQSKIAHYSRYFDLQYGMTHKGWKELSPLRVHRKNRLRARYLTWVMEMESVVQDFYDVRVLYSKGFTPEDIAKYSKEKSKVNDLLAGLSFPDVFVYIEVEPLKGLLYNLVVAECLEGEERERVLLYLLVGCTPESIEDYKLLPTTYLLKIFETL